MLVEELNSEQVVFQLSEEASISVIHTCAHTSTAKPLQHHKEAAGSTLRELERRFGVFFILLESQL